MSEAVTHLHDHNRYSSPAAYLYEPCVEVPLEKVARA
jgi:hypothetical protein